MITLDWHGLSPQDFLDNYWQQKPLFIRNAVSGLNDLLDGDDLAGLSTDAEVESRIIYRHKDDPAYKLHIGPFCAQDFTDKGSSHWTLLVQAVNHYLPELSALLDAFAFIPNWLIDDVMVSYATPYGGVGPHYDQYDVFLIQASGSRDWHIGQTCDGQTVLADNPDIKLIKDFRIEHTFHCQTGDILYLPPGLSHNGIATSEHCITYSVGARAPSWALTLENVLDNLLDVLPADDLYRSQGTLKASETSVNNGRFQPELLLEPIKQKIIDHLNSDAAAHALVQAMSTTKYENYQPLIDDPAPLISELSNDDQLIRDEASRFLYCNQPLSFYINGESVKISPENFSLAQLLANNRTIPFSTVQKYLNNPAATQLLQDLLNRGLLRLA